MGKMKRALSGFGKAITGTLCYYPVEISLLLYSFVIGALQIEDVELENEMNLALVPLFFALAFILNNLLRVYPRTRKEDTGAGNNIGPEGKDENVPVIKFRAVHLFYYLCWIPIIPLWCLDPESWVESPKYVVALVCAVCGITACRLACDNRRFVSESLAYLINWAIALLFASIACSLILGIYYSTTYIFGIESSSHFLEYVTLFTYVIAGPLLFLSFTRGNIGRFFFPNRFFDILLNYIVSPALLVYAVVLYVYFIKIAVLWELPEGGVAYMVFAFTMIAMLVKGSQPLLSRSHFGWFFDRFSLISIPAVIMFWVAVVYRICDYGFTELRIYLLLCGIVMTATLVMFACRDRGRYLNVVFIIIGLSALFTYIKPISAEHLAISSQKCRVMKLAGRLEMMGQDGLFKGEGELPAYDSLYMKDYGRIYESLYYLEDNDAGITCMRPEEFRNLYPGQDETYNRDISQRIYLHNYVTDMDISDYSRLVETEGYSATNGKYYYSNSDGKLTLYEVSGNPGDTTAGHVADSVEVAGSEDSVVLTEIVQKPGVEIWSVSLDSLFDAQLSRIGFSRNNIPPDDVIEQKYSEFFIFDTDTMRIVFSDMYIDPKDGGCELTSADIQYILMK